MRKKWDSIPYVLWGIVPDMGESREKEHKKNRKLWDGGKMKAMGKDMVENEGREIRGSKEMEGFDRQDKQFVLDMEVSWD